jgi:hypothetical protein
VACIWIDVRPAYLRAAGNGVAAEVIRERQHLRKSRRARGSAEH